MRNPSISRQKLLKKWIRVLQICTSSKKEMSIVERTKAIKLSADLAMASTRTGRTNWSRAIISDQANWNAKEKSFSQTPLLEKLKRASNKLTTRNLKLRRRKILQKSNGLAGRERKFNGNTVAKRWIQRKTQILRRLIPGGESVDENDLIEETLDYISSLRAQIDVMRCLVIADDAAKQ